MRLETLKEIVIIIAGGLFILEKFGITGAVVGIYKHKTVSGDVASANELNKELFEKKYYRDIATDEVVSLLNDWLCVIMQPEDCFAVKPKQKESKILTKDTILKRQMIDVQTRMVLYCSGRTISLFSLYMQYAYTQNDKVKGDGKSDQEVVFIVALLISNIRFDYSGDFIDPLDIIRIKIADFEKISKDYKTFRLEYKKYYLA
jgi:hypothetical protein